MLSFADNTVIYVAGNRVDVVQNKLDTLVDDVNRYYAVWNLRLNPQNCETILFRKPLVDLTSKAKSGAKYFQISATISGTCNKVLIPHRKVVKYLGVHLDYLLRCNRHFDALLEKAYGAFRANGRLFHNKFLSSRAKVILYMLLVRPIMAYAAPVLWKHNHTVAEKLRVLERRVLRACLGLYRTQASDWQHFVSNRVLYNRADIPRIDLHLIKLTRNFFSILPTIDNDAINSLAT